MPETNFYLHLSKLCKKNCVTVRETCANLGMQFERYRALKRGRPPTEPELELLSQHFGCTKMYLLTGVDAEPANNRRGTAIYLISTAVGSMTPRQAVTFLRAVNASRKGS